MSSALVEEIKVGDYVRSYDFEGREDCYVEGIVNDILPIGECDRYFIKVSKRVWAGVEEIPTRVVEAFPPVNGTPTWMGEETHFVVKVS